MHVTREKESRRRYLLAALIFIVIAALAVWAWQRGAGAAPSPTQPPTTTSPGTPTLVEKYPTGGITNGYAVIYLPDYVYPCGSYYCIDVNAYGQAQVVAALGGSPLSANVTYGIVALTIDNTRFVLFGVASTSSAVTQDYPNGISIRLNGTSGVVYVTLATGKKAAIYYTGSSYNVSGTIVYVWVPATQYPTTLAQADYHIVMQYNPLVVYVNNMPYGVSYVTGLSKYTGVLYTWGIYTQTSGRYSFQISP